MQLIQFAINSIDKSFSLCAGKERIVSTSTTSLFPPLPGPSKVCVDVEVSKQEPEKDGMESNPPHESPWIVTLSEQELEWVDKYSHELHLSKKWDDGKMKIKINTTFQKCNSNKKCDDFVPFE